MLLSVVEGARELCGAGCNDFAGDCQERARMNGLMIWVQWTVAADNDVLVAVPGQVEHGTRKGGAQ